MPKPTKYATPICLVLTIIAAIGLLIGWYQHNAFIILLLLLPAVIYEVYRTEGESTRTSSWILLITIVLELYFIWKNVSFNLADYFNMAEQYVGGFWVPLGDIKVVAPILMAILAVILFFRTYGKYTKWLAIVIFASAAVAVYIINPEVIKTMLPGLLQQGANSFY